MALYLLIFSAIVVICIFFNKFSGKFGIPVLLLFLVLGLLCGSQYDGFASNWCSNKFNGCSNGLLHSASRKLGLKNRTAPLLEMESGAVFLLKRISFQNNGFDMLLFIAIALVPYALPDLIGGNGYLSAYIVGIVLGNTEFPERRPLVSFFDAITSLMQIVIFFLLGMLAIPLNLLHSLLPAMIIFVFHTLVASPLAVCGVLAPFNKYPFRQLGLLSFVGLRGAASIVFAINILTSAHGPQSSVSARSLASCISPGKAIAILRDCRAYQLARWCRFVSIERLEPLQTALQGTFARAMVCRKITEDHRPTTHGPQSPVSARSLAFLQFIWQGNRHFTGLQGIFARAMIF